MRFTSRANEARIKKTLKTFNTYFSVTDQFRRSSATFHAAGTKTKKTWKDASGITNC